MMPIGPLMAEHRLIERMIAILRDELNQIEKTKKINPVFIDNIVDFIRTYADQTHHGKEEDILFRELENKDISKEHEKVMKELINEHIFARKTTGELVEAKERYIKGEKDAIKKVIEKVNTLISFYPKHIEKEDKYFFIPIMDYFTKEEQEAMLHEGQVFDRKMIHRKYNNIVLNFENNRGIHNKISKTNWIEYI